MKTKNITEENLIALSNFRVIQCYIATSSLIFLPYLMLFLTKKASGGYFLLFSLFLFVLYLSRGTLKIQEKMNIYSIRLYLFQLNQGII